MPLFLTPPKPIYHFLYIYFCSKKKARVAFSLLLIHPGTEESLCLKKQPPPPLQLSTEIHANCLKVQNLEFRLHFILQVSLIRKGQWIIKSATCSLTKLLWSLHMKWCYSVNKWNSYFYIIIHNIIRRCTHIYSHTHVGTFKGTTWKQTEMPQIKCLLRRSSFIIIKCEKYASSIKYSDQEKAIIHLLQPDVQGEQYFVLFYPNPFHLPGFHWCPAKKSIHLHLHLTTFFLSMQDLKNEATYFPLGLLLRDISHQLRFHSFLGHIFSFPLGLSTHHDHTANWICPEAALSAI